MALQDDIFDVADALKRKPERESFKRIMEQFNFLEQAYEEAMQTISAITNGVKAVQNVLKERN